MIEPFDLELEQLMNKHQEKYGDAEQLRAYSRDYSVPGLPHKVILYVDPDIYHDRIDWCINNLGKMYSEELNNLNGTWFQNMDYNTDEQIFHFADENISSFFTILFSERK